MARTEPEQRDEPGSMPPPRAPAAAAAPFVFELEPARHLLRVTKRGFWDMATLAAFTDAFRAALRRMKLEGGCRYCLVDASAFAVQSADVMQGLQALVDSFAPDCPARMAGITGSKLGALQACHGLPHAHRRIFMTRQEAEAWLFADAESSTTTAC